MDLLERVKKICGAEEALGITFSTKDVQGARLPVGAKLIGYTDSIYLCFVAGYQETVFAVDDMPDHEWRAWPVSYDFREFLRLIFSCGSTNLAAMSGIITPIEYERAFELETQKSHTGLKRLCEILSLTPIQDPYAYTHTVGTVIDCSRVIHKSERNN